MNVALRLLREHVRSRNRLAKGTGGMSAVKGPIEELSPETQQRPTREIRRNRIPLSLRPTEQLRRTAPPGVPNSRRRPTAEIEAMVRAYVADDE